MPWHNLILSFHLFSSLTAPPPRTGPSAHWIQSSCCILSVCPAPALLPWRRSIPSWGPVSHVVPNWVAWVFHPPRRGSPSHPVPARFTPWQDYKSPENDDGGGGGGGGGVRTTDNSMSSLQSTISSVSTLSEVSVVSEGTTCEKDSQPGAPFQIGDNVSEIDGSESGTRPGNDGNDSDSSSYSSVSTRGTYAMLSAAVERQQGPYTVEGREIAAEAMGQFPSLQEVLQAASEEQHLLDLEQQREGTAEPRSRRDSFSSRYLLTSDRNHITFAKFCNNLVDE